MSFCTIRVRQETREKLRALTAARRWKIVEAVDASVDLMLKYEGAVPPAKQPKRRRVVPA